MLARSNCARNVSGSSGPSDRLRPFDDLVCRGILPCRIHPGTSAGSPTRTASSASWCAPRPSSRRRVARACSRSGCASRYSPELRVHPSQGKLELGLRQWLLPQFPTDSQCALVENLARRHRVAARLAPDRTRQRVRRGSRSPASRRPPPDSRDRARRRCAVPARPSPGEGTSSTRASPRRRRRAVPPDELPRAVDGARRARDHRLVPQVAPMSWARPLAVS